MNDDPRTPPQGMDSSGTDTPKGDGTPTTDMSGSYGPPPEQNNPSSWQPEQYSSGQSSSTPSTPLPSYSDTPAQSTPPQYSYGYPPPQPQGQGQPTQYMPPPQQPAGQGYASPSTGPMQNQPPSFPPPNYTSINPQYTGQPVSYAGVAPKDPTVGLLLELIGYVGFLGIGHIWAGKTARGIGLMVGFWVYLFISSLLTIVLIGCVMLVAALAIPIASGFYLKNEMEKEQAAMGIRR
jgi:hypothetical protein